MKHNKFSKDQTQKPANASRSTAAADFNQSETDMKPSSENNPIRHTQKIEAQMRQLIDYLREDVGKVTEPKAHAFQLPARLWPSTRDC